MQFKTTMKYHFISVRMATVKKKITRVGDNMEKREAWCITGGNVNWYNHYGNSMEFPQKIKIELPYDSAILFQVIYWKKVKTLIRKYTWALMFISALFTIAKIWLMNG